MNEPTPPHMKMVQILAHPLAAEVAAEPGAPLRIAYTSTRVLPDAIARVQRLPGVVKMDRSELAESFKMLRNQLRQRMLADGHRVLGVTSPRPIRGKSITALNVALSLAADLDSAVLLVDAELSGKGLQQLFGLGHEAGLGEHLLEGLPIAELLINPGVERFVLLPAGGAAPVNSAELLATRAAQSLIAEMKQRYADRIIVIDLPPLLDRADALACLPQIDTTLVVVEDHGTTVPDLEQVAELMAPFNLIGTVVSRAASLPDAGARASRWARWWRSRAG